MTNTDSKLTEAYEEFTAGSQGFVKFVETHCGYDSSAEVIEAIADVAKTAEEFDRIWHNPTTAEYNAIKSAALEYSDGEEVFWGADRLTA